MLKEMSPFTRVFLLGMFLGMGFGVVFAVCELWGEDIGKLSS